MEDDIFTGSRDWDVDILGVTGCHSADHTYLLVLLNRFDKIVHVKCLAQWPVHSSHSVKGSCFHPLWPHLVISFFFNSNLFIYLFIYLFIFFLIFYFWMCCLRFCARAFSSCGKRGPLFIAVHRPLTVTASLVAEHRLQTRRLSSCDSRA